MNQRSQFNILRLNFYENPEFRKKPDNIRPSVGLVMNTDNSWVKVQNFQNPKILKFKNCKLAGCLQNE